MLLSSDVYVVDDMHFGHMCFIPFVRNVWRGSSEQRAGMEGGEHAAGLRGRDGISLGAHSAPMRACNIGARHERAYCYEGDAGVDWVICAGLSTWPSQWGQLGSSLGN